MADVVGRTAYFRHLIQDTSSIQIGYLGAGLVAVVVSGAQPGVALSIVLGALLAGGAVVGSKVIDQLLGIPVIGFVTVGGVVLIGILVILGGATVLYRIWPMIIVSGIGALVAAILVWMARNAPT